MNPHQARREKLGKPRAQPLLSRACSLVLNPITIFDFLSAFIPLLVDLSFVHLFSLQRSSDTVLGCGSVCACAPRSFREKDDRKLSVWCCSENRPRGNIRRLFVRCCRVSRFFQQYCGDFSTNDFRKCARNSSEV